MTLTPLNRNNIHENKRGLILYNDGKFGEALDIFDNILKFEPNFEYAMINKGLCLTELLEYEKAIKVFEDIMKISDVIKNNEKTDLFFDIAFAYFYNYDYKNAKIYLEKDLSFNENNLETLDYLGLTLFELGEYNEAIACFEKILIKKEGDIDAINNLGICLLETNNYDAAIIKFDIVLDSNPDFILSLYNKALALEGLKKYDEVIILLDKVLVIDTAYVDAIDKKIEIKNKLK